MNASRTTLAVESTISTASTQGVVTNATTSAVRRATPGKRNTSDAVEESRPDA